MYAFPPQYGVFKPLLLINFRLTNFFNTFLQFTNTNNELPVLQVSFAEVEKYVAYHYRLAHVRLLDPALQAAQLAGLNAVASPTHMQTLLGNMARDRDPSRAVDHCWSQCFWSSSSQGGGLGSLACSVPPPLSWHRNKAVRAEVVPAANQSETPVVGWRGHVVSNAFKDLSSFMSTAAASLPRLHAMYMSTCTHRSVRYRFCKILDAALNKRPKQLLFVNTIEAEKIEMATQ
ncbi:hypothetical protein BJY52DRAFT_1230985, partial [Lactarius psammicola]